MCIAQHALNHSMSAEHGFVWTGRVWYVLDQRTLMWDETPSKETVAARLTSRMLSSGVAWAPEERSYMESASGAANVLKRATDPLECKAFTSSLDANPDVLAFTNGLLELPSRTFRPIKPADLLSCTLNYVYTPSDEVDPATMLAVQQLYTNVFPVPEEREVFLRIAGYGLWGRRPHKMFMVITDQRGGNNGKSTVMKLLSVTLGGLAVANQNKFLYVGANESANSHSSGDMAFIGKRVAIFDETSGGRQLDVEKLKRCTGGGLDMSMRAANAVRNVDFKWTALIVIGCNQGGLPSFRSDEALASRMVVIPARAKFTNDPALLASDAHAFPCDAGFVDSVSELRCANLHVLLDAFERFHKDKGVGPLPPGCLQWRAHLAQECDPVSAILARWVDNTLVFAPRVSISRAEVIRMINNARYDEIKFSLITKTTKAELKKKLDVVMAARGASYAEDTTVEGVRVSRHYIGVARDCDECEDVDLKRKSTESASEAAFRHHLANATGHAFDSVRPEWLINPTTGCAMELDLYNSALRVAVEYDGPQHYEFPNPYHASIAEFKAQQTRDRLKERLCKQLGVKLYRVRAQGDVVQELLCLRAQAPDLFGSEACVATQNLVV